MKKVILVMVLIFPFVFQSCKKDEDNSSLAGTEWVFAYTLSGVTLETHLKFTDEKNVVTLYYDENGQISGEDTEYGTYAVSGSHIVITYTDGTTYSGTITGNKMSLIYDDDPSFTFTFVKK